MSLGDAIAARLLLMLRSWRRWCGWCLAALALILFLVEHRSAGEISLTWPQVVAGILLIAGLLYALFQVMAASRRPGAREDEVERARLEHERDYWTAQSGTLLICSLFFILVHSGGVESPFHPLVYAFASFLMVMQAKSRWALTWFTVAIALEVALPFIGGSGLASVEEQVGRGLLNAFFVAFFALGHRTMLRTYLLELRRHHARTLADELAHVRQAARDYRLEAAMPGGLGEIRMMRSEANLSRVGAVAVEEQVTYLLDILRRAYNLRSCVLLACETPIADTGSTKDEIKLHVRAASALDRKEIKLHDSVAVGVLAPAVRTGKTLRLGGLDKRRWPPYYRESVGVSDLCVVPLRMPTSGGMAVSALLCADRCEAKSFADEDVAAIESAAAHILRLADQERAFLAVDRAKAAQERLSAASVRLSSALALDEVVSQSVAALGQIVEFALAILFEWDEAAATHRVAAVKLGPAGESQRDWMQTAQRIEGRTFEHRGPGLVVSAIKNRLPICPRGQLAQNGAVLFEEDSRIGLARSAVVLPLAHGGRVLGTIVLVHPQAGLYSEEEVAILRVLSNQIAVSWQNGKMYAAVEAAATKDSLTGLLNRRAFISRLDDALALSARSGTPLSLILGDIDHFKRVNDTYGHPAGDIVIKRVAACLERAARKIDAVGRWGGEEFIIAVPGTDRDGAVLFAERILQQVQAEIIACENTTLRVTLSLGVAQFLVDAKNGEALVEAADRALYRSKQRGRNCVSSAGDAS
jgi:diguanylate cyclase (GGDEF)-like protein